MVHGCTQRQRQTNASKKDRQNGYSSQKVIMMKHINAYNRCRRLLTVCRRVSMVSRFTSSTNPLSILQPSADRRRMK